MSDIKEENIKQSTKYKGKLFQNKHCFSIQFPTIQMDGENVTDQNNICGTDGFLSSQSC